MADPHRPSGFRQVFNTRASVLAAWFIFIVVVWPVLWLFVLVSCLLCVDAILTTLYPGLERAAVGMIISFEYLPPVFFASAVVAAIGCYKAGRYVIAPWRESKPLACEIGTATVVLIATAVAFVFWAWLAALLAVP